MGRGGIALSVLALLTAVLGASIVVAAPAAAAGLSSPAAEPGIIPIKYYVVPKPVDGRAESLFDIAQRTLGDRVRAREILELTRDLPQPGGQRMTGVDQIRPGWTLRLPMDAEGKGVRIGHVWAPGSRRGPRPQAAAPDTGVRPGADEPATGSDGDRRPKGGEASQAASPAADPSNVLGQGAAVLAVLLALAAAGYLVLSRRRVQTLRAGGRHRSAGSTLTLPIVGQVWPPGGRDGATSALRNGFAPGRHRVPSGPVPDRDAGLEERPISPWTGR
jgi:hypothetical protein